MNSLQFAAFVLGIAVLCVFFYRLGRKHGRIQGMGRVSSAFEKSLYAATHEIAKERGDDRISKLL